MDQQKLALSVRQREAVQAMLYEEVMNVICLKHTHRQTPCPAAKYLTGSHKKYILVIDSDFTGKLELHCKQGIINKAVKSEDLKIEEDAT
jgi:hypothetical protein